YGIAGQAMRRILVEYARAKNREKRGGAAGDLPLDEATLIAATGQNIDLLALDEALTRLAAMDEQQARVVELKYFSGLSIEETAEALSISPATGQTRLADGQGLAKARADRLRVQALACACQSTT